MKSRYNGKPVWKSTTAIHGQTADIMGAFRRFTTNHVSSLLISHSTSMYSEILFNQVNLNSCNLRVVQYDKSLFSQKTVALKCRNKQRQAARCVGLRLCPTLAKKTSGTQGNPAFIWTRRLFGVWRVWKWSIFTFFWWPYMFCWS